jgi:hypothetical protein
MRNELSITSFCPRRKIFVVEGSPFCPGDGGLDLGRDRTQIAPLDIGGDAGDALDGVVVDQFMLELGRTVAMSLSRVTGALGNVSGVTTAAAGEIFKIGGLVGKLRMSLTVCSFSTGVLTATW